MGKEQVEATVVLVSILWFETDQKGDGECTE